MGVPEVPDIRFSLATLTAVHLFTGSCASHSDMEVNRHRAQQPNAALARVPLVTMKIRVHALCLAFTASSEGL